MATAPPVPSPLPSWLVPWATWQVMGKKYPRPQAPLPIPKWALWFPAWCQWRLKNSPPPRPASLPTPIPQWAWKPLEAVAKAVKVPPPPPPAHGTLAFWRRMGVWVTRIDHMPASWLMEYGRGQYGNIIVPTLFGLEYEVSRDALRTYVSQLRGFGFTVCGSQWGLATTVAAAQAEAEAAAEAAEDFDGWVMNGEKPYEGGGKAAVYSRRFRQLQPSLPFGWTPEPQLELDHCVQQELGVCYMPQAYPLENRYDVGGVVDVGRDRFKYTPDQMVPLVQAYPRSDGARPVASEQRDQARARGVSALILYTGNQALDVPQWWRDLVV